MKSYQAQPPSNNLHSHTRTIAHCIKGVPFALSLTYRGVVCLGLMSLYLQHLFNDLIIFILQVFYIIYSILY